MHVATSKYKGKLYASVKMKVLWGIFRQHVLANYNSLFIQMAIIKVEKPMPILTSSFLKAVGYLA